MAHFPIQKRTKVRFKCRHCEAIFEPQEDLISGDRLYDNIPITHNCGQDGWEGLAYPIAMREEKDDGETET